MTTGHCADDSTVDFVFNNWDACGSNPAGTEQICSGTRLDAHSQRGKDLQAIYELAKS
jgi:hypothetical protein